MAYSPSARAWWAFVSTTTITSPAARRIERDVHRPVLADVEEQHVAGPAGGRGHLIHQSARHSDVVVLGVLGQPGDLGQRDLVVEEGGERKASSTFHRGGRRETGADRDLGVQRQVDAAQLATGLDQSPEHPEDVARPGVIRGRRSDLRQRQHDHGAGTLGRDHSHHTVVVAGGGYVCPGVDGERQTPDRCCSRCVRRSG